MSKKKALTIKQRMALQRRAAKRELDEALADLMNRLTRDDNPRAIPAPYRVRTTRALGVLLQGGPVFVLACAKAYISRGCPRPDKDRLWQFIDEHNAQFAAQFPPDMVARWNAPDYDELPRTQAPGL